MREPATATHTAVDPGGPDAAAASSSLTPSKSSSEEERELLRPCEAAVAVVVVAIAKLPLVPPPPPPLTEGLLEREIARERAALDARLPAPWTKFGFPPPTPPRASRRRRTLAAAATAAALAFVKACSGGGGAALCLRKRSIMSDRRSTRASQCGARRADDIVRDPGTLVGARTTLPDCPDPMLSALRGVRVKKLRGPLSFSKKGGRARVAAKGGGVPMTTVGTAPAPRAGAVTVP